MYGQVLGNRLIILALATFKILQYKSDILIYGRLGTTIKVPNLMSAMWRTLGLSFALLVLKFVLHLKIFSLKAFSALLYAYTLSGRTITYMRIAYSLQYMWALYLKLHFFCLYQIKSTHVNLVHDKSVIQVKSL